MKKRCLSFVVSIAFMSRLWSLECQYYAATETDTIKPYGFFEPATQFDNKRFYLALSGGIVAYSSMTYGLYHLWYKDYPRSGFHFFNDWGEWRNMDKYGHVYSAYTHTLLAYRVARWTGLSERKSLLTGAIASTLIQSTIEVMDGFSAEWGFSIADFSANTLGTTVFILQQSLWKEQRIQIKFSSYPYNHPDIAIGSSGSKITLRHRAEQLFGSSFMQRMMKDYNSQTYWLSFNLQSFGVMSSAVPSWLNASLGISAGNLYGGYANKWTENGILYDASAYPRFTRFYISPDIDFTKIKVKSPFLKTLMLLLNLTKAPLPALEINTRGEVIFHFVKF